MLSMEMFTATEKKIMGLLQDGMPHTVGQCIDSMGDPTWTYDNLLPHLSHINAKIRPHGYDVAFVKIQGRMHYRLVRLVASAVKE